MTDFETTESEAGRSSDDDSILDGLEAEAAEEQHLDERHATGEHFTGGSDESPEADSL